MQGNRQVARAGLLMAVATAFCRVASSGKEILVAGVFGAGIIIDAYALAILVPALAMSLFVNAVRRAFLTRYPRYEADGPDSTNTFANEFVCSLFALSILVAVVASLTLRWIWPVIIMRYRPDLLELSLALLVPVSWLVVPTAAIAGLTAVLNARHEFSRPQLTAIVPTVCVILVVLIGGRTWGAFGLIMGLLVGSVLQAAVLAVMVVASGHRLRWQLDARSQAFLDLWKFTLPIIVIDLVSQGNVVVDLVMAGTLKPGNVAILNWSAQIKTAIASTLIASLLTVLLPHFSRQVARGATEELRHTCAQLLRYGALLLFPVSALLIVCAPAVSHHFDMGQLSSQAAAGIAIGVAAYGLGLFADLASSGLFQALMALSAWRAMIVLVIFSNFIPNIIFNQLLIEPFGTAGLAASTSLVGYLTLICNYLVLRRAIGMADEAKTVRVVLGALTASVLMAASGILALELARRTLPLPSGLWSDILLAGAAALAATLVYAFLILVYPGSEDARLVLAIIRDKVRAIRAGGTSEQHR